MVDNVQTAYTALLDIIDYWGHCVWRFAVEFGCSEPRENPVFDVEGDVGTTGSVWFELTGCIVRCCTEFIFLCENALYVPNGSRVRWAVNCRQIALLSPLDCVQPGAELQV